MGDHYYSKARYYAALQQKATKRNKTISLLRLVLFVIALLAVYFTAIYLTISAVVAVATIFLVAFVLLLKYHSTLIYKLRILDCYKQLNENEHHALNGDYHVFYDGEKFHNPDHPYAYDIDLFGKGSLYQYLNRAVTSIGMEQLANKLKDLNFAKKRIIELQSFIGFLAKEIDWRQKFQSLGMAHAEGINDKEKVLKWATLPLVFQHGFFMFMVIVTPVLTTAFTLLLAYDLINFQNYLLYLVFPWGIAGIFIKKTNSRHMTVSKTSEMLVKFSVLIKAIDELKQKNNIQFPDELQAIDTNQVALKLKKLSSILNALDNRLNPVSWTFLNALFLWDILQMIRLENWQKSHRQKINEWFYLIAEIDALSSLANFNYNIKNSCIPEISESGNIVFATDLGHPLIPLSHRVNNDVQIPAGSFALITGANMAGKSTYLRTIATSMVLAMNGCRVPAKKFCFKPVQLYTSIRTQDSLQKNESYFYAELLRLKGIIDKLREGHELFIILDEILKGTNSRDKHQGSEALLKQLIGLQSSGIVATHDIALGELEKSFPQNIMNYCFEVEIDGNELKFDYKLRKGVSKNLNATLLMKKMGITL